MQDDHLAPIRVHGLVVPPLLLVLLREGKWNHPGEPAIARVMPWFRDPLDGDRDEPAQLLGIHPQQRGLRHRDAGEEGRLPHQHAQFADEVAGLYDDDGPVVPQQLQASAPNWGQAWMSISSIRSEE